MIPGISKCSGGNYDRASDPWVSFAPNGDLYSLSLSFDAFDNHNAIIVNKSTNGGESWGPALEVTADDTDGLDKQSITADPYNANLVYAVWDRFLSPPGINANDQGKINARSYVQQAWFSRTTNGGASWEPAARPLQPGHARGDDRKHRRRPAERDARPPRRDGHHRRPQDAASRPARSRSSARRTRRHVGQESDGHRQIDPTFPGPVDPDNGHGIRGGELPDFAVDPHNGNVYAAWDDDSLNGIDSIFFSQSTNGGANWSAADQDQPDADEHPAGNQQAFTATVRGGERHGRGDVLRPARNTSAPGLPTDYWLVRCSANCASAASWGNEAHVGGPFDLEQAAYARGYFVGDYEGMTTSGNVFQPFFGMAVDRATNPSDAFFATSRRALLSAFDEARSGGPRRRTALCSVGRA